MDCYIIRTTTISALLREENYMRARSLMTIEFRNRKILVQWRFLALMKNLKPKATAAVTKQITIIK